MTNDRSSRKLRYEENNIFKDDSIFSCILLSILVIVWRVAGSDFDKIFEVPEIIQKVLEYDPGP